MAKAVQLPSGSWRVRIYDNELKKQVSFTSQLEGKAGKAEAELLAREYLLNRKKRKEAGPTIGECLDKYINIKSNVLSPTTIFNYRNLKDRYLTELFDYPINDVKSVDLQEAFNNLAEHLAPSTCTTVKNFLFTVLDTFAPDRKFKITLPKEQKKKKDLLTAEEVLSAVIDTDMELPCLLAMWCSFRKSEVRGIKKSDIKDVVLYIHETMVVVDNKDVLKQSTKTYESARAIALPQIILDLIDKLPEDQEFITTLSGSDLYHHLKAALKRKGLHRMSFHDLRHLNASIMAMLQIPDKYAMERGGWSTDQVMKQIYQHTFTDERKAADEKINDYFNSVYDKIKNAKEK